MLQVISPIWDGFEAVRYTSVPLLIRIDLFQGDVTVVGVDIFSLPAFRVMVANPPDAFTSKLTRWLSEEVRMTPRESRRAIAPPIKANTKAT